MSNQLLVIIFWMLAFSCKAPVSSLYQDKVSLISAEKTDWSGGRAGVRGTIYTIKLKKKNSKDIVIIKSLKAEGDNISFAQFNSGNVITVKGNLQSENQIENFENMPSGAPIGNKEHPQNLNSKDSWIEYTVKDSKKLYKLNIPKFTSVEPVGDLIPQRQ